MCEWLAVYTKYWDALTPFYSLLICVKTVRPDVMLHYVVSDLGQLCFLRPIFPNT